MLRNWNEPNLRLSLTFGSATAKESFLVITAYNLGSLYESDGICVLTVDAPTPISQVFSVTQPARVNLSSFQSIAETSFRSYLGFSSCSLNSEQIAAPASGDSTLISMLATPTAFTLHPSIFLTSSPDLSFTTSISTRTNSQNVTTTGPNFTPLSDSPDTKIKVANGVAIPIGVLGLASLGWLVYRRRKKYRASKGIDSPLQNSELLGRETQPYLQQKSELEAEGKRKHELEARETRHEIGTEGERYELPGERGLVIRSRQELRGEEHGRELETSSTNCTAIVHP